MCPGQSGERGSTVEGERSSGAQQPGTEPQSQPETSTIAVSSLGRGTEYSARKQETGDTVIRDDNIARRSEVRHSVVMSSAGKNAAVNRS